MKFWGRVGLWIMNIRLDLGTDLNLDPESFFSIFPSLTDMAFQALNTDLNSCRRMLLCHFWRVRIANSINRF